MNTEAIQSHAAAAQQTGSSAPVHLTPRQLEVLALLCEGLPNKLICRRLNICTGTVKVHIGSILRELGVSSRLQAVVAAHRFGLLGEAIVGMPQEEGDEPMAPQYRVAPAHAAAVA